VREIRCDRKFFGQVSENSIGIFVAQCKSVFCKTRPDASEIVEHHWNLEQTNEDGIIKPVETVRIVTTGSERK